MLNRFFLIDWILTYVEKPKIEQTPADELLFYAALLIIFIAVMCIYVIIYNIKRGDKK